MGAPESGRTLCCELVPCTDAPRNKLSACAVLSDRARCLGLGDRKQRTSVGGKEAEQCRTRTVDLRVGDAPTAACTPSDPLYGHVPCPTSQTSGARGSRERDCNERWRSETEVRERPVNFKRAGLKQTVKAVSVPVQSP